MNEGLAERDRTTFSSDRLLGARDINLGTYFNHSDGQPSFDTSSWRKPGIGKLN